MTEFLPVIGLDANLLTGWYDAKRLNATIGTARQTVSAQNTATTRDNDSARGPTDTVPPWLDIDSLPSPDEKLRNALATTTFINEKSSALGGGDIHPDHRKLFAIYKGLDTLQAIAGHAANEDTSALLLRGLDRRFQDGLSEVLTYIDNLDTADFELTAGAKRKQADGEIAVPRTLSQFTGPPVHFSSINDPMAGLAGTEQFTVSVTKSGVTTAVAMDLSEISGDLTLDAVVEHMNGKMEAAGMVSRFDRERILRETDEVEDDEADPKPPPDSFGLVIKGVSTEALSFSASNATAMVRVAGVSGTGNREAGQLLGFTGIDSATPQIDGGPRIEPEEQGDEEQDTSVQAQASATDSQGNTYVTGTTRVDLGNGAPLGETDAFISKYASTGQLLWTRSLGASDDASAQAIAIDQDDNVIVAGQVTGDAVTGALGGGKDAFVTKLDSRGQTLFTRQVSPTSDDGALGLATGTDGSIYVTGYTNSALASGLTHGGGTDGTLTKLDAGGALVYQRQFGGAGNDRAGQVAVAQDGNLIVASVEDGKGVVRKFSETDPTAAPLWEITLGDLNGGQIGALAVDGGTVYVAGGTRAGGLTAGGTATELGSYNDARDGFFTRINDAGATAAAQYTQYVGTGASDDIHTLAVHNGDVILGGDTQGALNGGDLRGTKDGFIARYGADGTHMWTEQYGGREKMASARSITVEDQGRSVLDVLGLPKGEIDYGQARTVTAHGPVRAGQYFSVAVDGGRPEKITIEADDTMRELARKVENVLLLKGEARVRRTSEGDRLRIEGAENVRIELIPGEGNDDALRGLGLAAGTIVNDGSLLDGDDEEDPNAPLFFGLGLERNLDLTNRTDATHANKVILDSLAALRKAFNTLTRDPELDALLKEGAKLSGPVPAHIQGQLANYQAGLDRLLGGGPTVGGLF